MAVSCNPLLGGSSLEDQAPVLCERRKCDFGEPRLEGFAPWKVLWQSLEHGLPTLRFVRERRVSWGLIGVGSEDGDPDRVVGEVVRLEGDDAYDLGPRD